MAKFVAVPGMPGMMRPERPIAPTVDWIVRESGINRTAVDNFIRGNRHSNIVMRALSADFNSRVALMQQIGKQLGIFEFKDAKTVEDVMNAAKEYKSKNESVSTSGKALVEMVQYKKGHKNSKGEDAPWTIVSHETGKILSSHKTKKKAEEHLRQMEYYKHAKNESAEGQFVSFMNEVCSLFECQEAIKPLEEGFKEFCKSI